MKLSQDILLFRLLLNYPAQLFSQSESNEQYGYPIIYEPGADLAGHVVIIRADDLEDLLSRVEPGTSLFVCIGKLFKKTLNMPSVITIEKNISLISVNNYLIRTYDEFERWDASLKNVINKCGSFQDLINCCAPIIAEPIAFFDRSLKIIAESEFSKELDYNNDAAEFDNSESAPKSMYSIAAAEQRSDANISIPYIPLFKDERILFRDLIDNEEFVGRIAIHLSANAKILQNYYNEVLSLFYVYAVKLYNECSSFKVREIPYNRLSTLLLHSLHNKKISEKLWEEAFKENGWDKDSRFLLVQFIPNSLKGNGIKNIYAQVLSYQADNKLRESLCFVYRERLLLFINIDKSAEGDAPDPVEALVEFSKSHLLIAGVSRVFRGMQHLRSAYAQTITAIEYGTVQHPASSCYFFDDYAFSYILHSCMGTFENEEICSNKLVALVQYDREKGTDYYNTLRTYFLCKYNAAEAAKRLFINRSTFHYRLERIQELVNIDFNADNELLYLALSFKMWEQ